MKITKTQLRQIIKEELAEVTRHGQDAPTEFEIYAQVSEVTKQFRQIIDNLGYATGTSGREFGVDLSQMSDETSGMIYDAFRKLDSARIALANEIGQSPNEFSGLDEALEEGPGRSREDALDAAYAAIIKRFGRGALMDPMKPMTPAEAEARMNPYVAPPLAPEDKPTETDKRYGRTRRGQKGGSLGS